MACSRIWLHGLAAAAFGGAATALAQLLAAPPAPLSAELLRRDAGAVLMGALVAVLAYFKQSPLATAAGEPPPGAPAPSNPAAPPLK